MKNKIDTGKVFFISILCMIGFLLIIPPCLSKEIKKVAVLPFVINSKDDLAFLQKGIFDMFSSRLSYADEVEVLTWENLELLFKNSSIPFSLTQLTRGVTEAKAKELGKFLNVDHVLFGSLTLFGDSMSLDVNMIDINETIPSLTFFRQGKEAGMVIPELNKIAEEINFKVFGRETLEFQSQMALQKAYSGEGNNYASPLKKFTSLLTVKGKMNSVASGDLDGDKKDEVVVVYDRTIQILKYSFNGKTIPVQKLEDDSVAMSIVSVDVADINHNGYSEIFVTRINNRNQSVDSYVIEYTGSQYVRKKATYPWYFRVIKYPNGTKELFAQRHTQKGPWYPNGVFKVDWKGNGYTLGARLRVPENKGFSLLSMTAGMSVTLDNQKYLYTDLTGQLVLFNDAGRVEWVSDKGYGGSPLFYKFPKAVHGTGDHEYAFLQPKNILFDMDSDGKLELFVIKNKETSDYLFKNIRVFKKGSIEILGWNDMGLSFEKAPKKLPGLITSIDIGDYDNDSKMELLVTMIKKGSDSFSNSSKSILVAYDLD